MATIAEAFVQITPTTKNMQGDIAKSLSGLDKVGAKAGKELGDNLGKTASANLGEKLSKGLGKTLKGGLIGVGVAAGGALAGAMTKGFGRLQALDQAESKLKGLGFGAADVERAMDGVTKSVKGTAFGLDEAAGSAAKFTGVGMQIGNELDRAMKLTADIAAQSGTGMDDVSNILAKIAGAGKLTGETLAQLDERAVGASDAIAKHFGVSIDEARAKISAGEVDFETFSEAMEAKLGGAAQATGDTFKGSMDNMMSAMGRFGAKLLEPVFASAPAVFAAVGGAFDDLGESLEPVIASFAEWLAPQMENFATNVIPLVVDGIVALVDGFINLVQWGAANMDWLGPLAAAVAGAAGAFGVWVGAISLWQSVTKIAVGVQAAFNAVMAANPIMLTVMAIAALVAGLTYFFTQTETGRELWANFTQSIGDAWDWVVEKFQAGVQWIQDAWEGLTSLIVDGDFTGALREAFGWEEDSPIVDKILTIRDGITGLYDLIVNGDFTGALRNAFGWEEDAPIVSAITNIRNVFTDFEGTTRRAWEILKVMVFDAIKSVVAAVAVWFAERIQSMRNSFNSFRDGANGVINAIKGYFSSFKQRVFDVASAVVGRIRSLPQQIKSAFANAGSWLLNAGRDIIQGLANGIRSAVGVVQDALRAVIPDNLEKFVPGLHFGGLVGYARGGVLPDIPGISRNQRDPILGVNGQGIPVARVEPGEFVVNRESTKKYGRLLAAINAGRIDGSRGDFGLPAYRNGGVVSAKQLLAFARGQNVDGKQAPRSLEGAPYVWGGGLLGNWGDCSGAMSGLAAFTVGMALAGRKFATMNQDSVLTSMGFSRGRGPGKNSFEIGHFNGGPYGGHTSGTIYDANGNAINVEMGGGRGNGQIGGPAAGSRHSQYSNHNWIGLKSAVAEGIKSVVSTSTRGVTVERETDKGVELDQIDWGTANNLASEWEKKNKRGQQLKRWIGGIYDTGGVLPSGRAAVNLSGKPEVVINNAQLGAINKLANNVGVLARKLDMEDLALEFATQLEEKDAFGRQMLKDMQKGDSIKAYLGSIGLSEGVDLADSIGSLIGIDGIGSTFGGVASAWEGMEDAAVAQVDAADAVTQAENNLVIARKSGDKEAIAKAESELEQAKGVASMAAAAVGQAQVAMAIEVVSLIINLVKGLIEWIDGQVQAVFEAQVAAWGAVADAMGNIGKLSEVVAGLRHEVTALAVDWGMAQLELANAFRNLRMVQHDGMVAQLEGAVDLAEAQAAFDAQRQADMRAAMFAYDDLSLAYDRFRWAAVGANQDIMDSMVEWSDASHALYEKLLAAQLNQRILEHQATLNNLQATWELTKASLDLNDVTSELGVAAAKLAVASGQAFGMGQGQATVAQQYAKLAAELAQLKADNASIGTWINPFNWGKNGLMGQNKRRMAQIEQQMAQLQQREEFKDIDPAVAAQVNDLVKRAGWMGFFGSGDKVAQMIENSALGDAGRALDWMEFENKLIDIEAEADERRRLIERKMAELEHRSVADPLESLIRGLESERSSHETMARYWETQNEGVREALLKLAELQAEGSKVVQLSGDAFSVAEVEKMLGELGIRVERLENPKPSAAEVAAARR